MTAEERVILNELFVERFKPAIDNRLIIMGTAIREEAPLTTTLKPIYARFVFKERRQALCFAELVPEREWVVSVNYAPERALWQATVRREIHPVFRDITIWLATLTSRAAPSNGECDGWGH